MRTPWPWPENFGMKKKLLNSRIFPTRRISCRIPPPSHR
jgi:hypothetical protein